MTGPTLTLVELSCRLSRANLEAAISEADKRDLIGFVELRRQLERFEGRAGVATLRRCLDRDTFALTDSSSNVASCELLMRLKFRCRSPAAV